MALLPEADLGLLQDGAPCDNSYRAPSAAVLDSLLITSCIKIFHTQIY